MHRAARQTPTSRDSAITVQKAQLEFRTSQGKLDKANVLEVYTPRPSDPKVTPSETATVLNASVTPFYASATIIYASVT
jgi:hypothetical protein